MSAMLLKATIELRDLCRVMAALHTIQTPSWSLESCATNSRIMNGRPMLPNKGRGVSRVDDRRILNGICWAQRSGALWCDMAVAQKDDPANRPPEPRFLQLC